jgi:predicted dehydrogenase
MAIVSWEACYSQPAASFMTRRNFIQTSGLTASLGALGAPITARSTQKLRLAIVGTGEHGTETWGKRLLDAHGDIVEFAGLCDRNAKRVQAAQGMIGTNAPAFTDFDRMIRETEPHTIIVATIDANHWRYITRAMALGINVISEKPLCTDETQCQAILDAGARTGGKLTMAFNARHLPEAKKVKQLLLEKVIGDILSVDYHEYLNTWHGGDYFRRWHYRKENSGTLLCSESSHHFDQVNWWLDSIPVSVSAAGDLRFYGRNHSFRSTHCRVCPHTQNCSFYWDVNKREDYVKLYVNCESEDGYLRDACVWREDTDIYDTMSVRVKYESGAILTYTANTYLPYEGQSISFSGTKGRLDVKSFGDGGVWNKEVRLTRNFGSSETFRDFESGPPETHNGADASLQHLIFRNPSGPDPLHLRAGVQAGALSSLMGIAAYRSIERDGQPIRIADLVKL